jgi:hypothetical protein
MQLEAFRIDVIDCRRIFVGLVELSSLPKIAEHPRFSLLVSVRPRLRNGNVYPINRLEQRRRNQTLTFGDVAVNWG